MKRVQLNDTQYFYDHNPYSEGWWLDDKVFTWLLNNAGPGSQCGAIREGDQWFWSFSIHDNRPQSNAIFFFNADHAVLFKLTWGG